MFEIESETSVEPLRDEMKANANWLMTEWKSFGGEEGEKLKERGVDIHTQELLYTEKNNYNWYMEINFCITIRIRQYIWNLTTSLL